MKLSQAAIKPLEKAQAAIEVAKKVVQKAIDNANNALKDANKKVAKVTADCEKAVDSFEDKKKACGGLHQLSHYAAHASVTSV